VASIRVGCTAACPRREGRREPDREIVFVDAAGWRSPAVLEHACRDEEACVRAGGNPMRQLRSIPAEEALACHWAVTDEDEAEDSTAERLTRGPVGTIRRTAGAKIACRRFLIDGHEYISLDTSSGLRRYRGSKAWFGGYYLAGTDFFSGLPVAVQVFRADIQEWDGYPALFDHMLGPLGEPPSVVSGDRGFAIRASTSSTPAAASRSSDRQGSSGTRPRRVPAEPTASTSTGSRAASTAAARATKTHGDSGCRSTRPGNPACSTAASFPSRANANERRRSPAPTSG